MIGLPVSVKLLCLSAVPLSPVASSPVSFRLLTLSIKGLSFSPVSSGLLLLALALLLILLVVRFYARKDTHLSTPRRRLLLGLRIAAFMCVILALLQPAVNLESQESRRPRVFVLVDGSASMKLPFDLAAGEDSSRSRAGAALGVAQSLLKKLPRRFDSSLYVFSDSLKKIEEKQGLPIAKRLSIATRSSISTGSEILNAPGSRTALGQALEDISARAGKTPAAVVVISDGASTFGPDPTKVAKRIWLPVYTVLAANEGFFRDIEITEVLHPTSGYAGTEVPVLIRVKGYGLENLDVPLSISEGENVVSRGMLKLAGAAETEILLSLKPVSAGLHFYKVSVPAVRGEASAVNNAASFALRVLSEKLKVLYLEGDFTWDFTFLKRQLESDPKLETTFVLVSGRKMKQPALEGFVSSARVDLGRSSIVFIGDGAARHLGPDTWRSLDDFVSSGGGLLIAGAEGSNEIPLSAQKLLPAQLLKHDAWGPEEYLNCMLTFDGLNHPICDIEKETSSNASSWKEISPLLGSHVIESAKPGASVLVEGSTGNKSFPVIVAGSYGKGRVLLIAASGLWRWGFSLPGMGGSDKLFSGFTSNAISWLSEAEKDRLSDMKPQSWVFENGEEVIFSGRGALEVSDKNGRVLSPVFAQRASTDSLTTNFGILEPGTYNYKTSYEEKGERTASAGSFLVDANGPEYRNLFPDSRLLTYVSEASGGKFFTTDQVDVLAREIQTFGEKATIERQVKLWNHPLLFLVFTMLVAIEWWLRRRSGLP